MTLNWRWTLLLLGPLALLLSVFTLWPAAFGLAYSFTNYAPLQNTPVRLVGLENYARMLAQPQLLTALGNVGLLSLLSVAFEMGLGLTLAYALRQPFRGRELVRALLLVPWLVSPVANGVMWHALYNTGSGLLNFWPALLGLPRPTDPLGGGTALLAVALAEIWRKTPLVTFLILPGVLAIPRAQWEEAALEGVNLWGRFRHILLPHLRPLLLTVGFLLTADALATGESLLILTGGGPGSATVTLGLFSYQQAVQSYNWALGSTSGWLVAALVGLVALGYLLATRREARV